MDPVSIGVMTAVSMAASAGGAFMSAKGAATQSQGAQQSALAQAGMYNYQAGVAKVNAQIARQNADYETNVGEVQAQQSGMKTRAQLGEIKAGQGASGLDVNSGSAVAVRESAQELGTYDASVIRSNAAKRAYGYEVEATQNESQAALFGMSAANATSAAGIAKETGGINVATSLLTGASSVSSKWMQAGQSGMFGSSSPYSAGAGGYTGQGPFLP
jgi:hypothetical protein